MSELAVLISRGLAGDPGAGADVTAFRRRFSGVHFTADNPA